MTSTLLDSTMKKLCVVANVAIGEATYGRLRKTLFQGSHFESKVSKAKLDVSFDGFDSWCSRSVRCTEISELHR